MPISNKESRVEETVQPTIYFYPTMLGHVAVGGPNFATYLAELNKENETYLSFGKPYGNNREKLSYDSTPVTRNEEAEKIYLVAPIKLKLPPCKKADFQKACKAFQELDRRDYNLFIKNCAHAVRNFMKTAGYSVTGTIDPRPIDVAREAQRIILNDLAEKRRAIKNDNSSSVIEKIIQLIKNDIARLRAQITSFARAQASADLLTKLIINCETYKTSCDENTSPLYKQKAQEILLNEFIKKIRAVDKKTAAHLIEALKLFEFATFAPAEDNSQHPAFLSELQKDIYLSAMRGNKLVLAAQQANIEVEPLLLRSDEMYLRMKEIVKTAKWEVLISGYKMDKDSDAEADLIGALEHLDKQPKETGKKIRVCILLDRKKGLASSTMFSNPTPNNSFRKGLAKFNNLNIQYVEHQHKGLGSYHQKIILVDGEKAILSSADLSKRNNYKKGNIRSWVDMSTIIKGETLGEYLRNDFRHAWDSNYCLPVGYYDKTAIPEHLDKPQKPGIVKDTVPTLFLSKKAEGNLFSRKHLSPFALAVIKTINAAKSSINIMTPNLNNPQIISALVNAVQRGVQVNIVMPKNMNDRMERLPFAGGINQSGIKNLYTALGKKYVNLDVRWSTNTEGAIMQGNLKESNLLHARMVTIDEEIVLVGSSMMDQQSIYQSREADVVIQSKKTAMQYNETIFQPVFEKAINIFLDPKNIIKAAGPVIGISRTNTVNKNQPAPLINNQEWRSTPDANTIFKVFTNTGEQRRVALQELLDLLEKPLVLAAGTQTSDVGSLDKDTARISCYKQHDKQFGLLETCIKPREAITSRLIMPKTFEVNDEEVRLMDLIHQQVQQGMKTLGVGQDETIKLTLYSLSAEGITNNRSLDIYERAYINYCLQRGLDCLDADNNLLQKETLKGLLNEKPIMPLSFATISSP